MIVSVTDAFDVVRWRHRLRSFDGAAVNGRFLATPSAFGDLYGRCTRFYRFFFSFCFGLWKSAKESPFEVGNFASLRQCRKWRLTHNYMVLLFFVRWIKFHHRVSFIGAAAPSSHESDLVALICSKFHSVRNRWRLSKDPDTHWSSSSSVFQHSGKPGKTR